MYETIFFVSKILLLLDFMNVLEIDSKLYDSEIAHLTSLTR